MRTSEEINNERRVLPLGTKSRIGNGSALVVAAALALTRETGGRHLLDIASTDGNHRQNADERKNYADPPVPNIRCDHGAMVATQRRDLPVTTE